MSTVRRMLRKNWFLLLSWLLFQGLGGVYGVAGAEEVDCEDCHRDVVDRDLDSRYVHSPFLKKQCAACHVAGQEVVLSTRQQLSALDEAFPQKIRWFRDSYGVSQSHWVLLPTQSLNGVLVFKTWDGDSRLPLQKLTLPALGQLPVREDDGQPPVIVDNVTVKDVRRGISTSATIVWTTDEFADSQVAYGFGTTASTKADRKLTRQHQVILTGLDADRKYNFQVSSRDLFGNQAQSSVMSFSTDQTFLAPEARHEESGAVKSDPKVEYHLFRHDDNYLVIFEADRPISLSLGVPLEDQATVSRQSVQLASIDASHPVLKSQVETNITACYACHTALRQIYSHPVNVFPKAGMVIPPEYPLLPDGRISCISCHTYHGGNEEYRLLKSGKKELCIGCHTDY